jgi:hypothetical protein
MTFPVALGRAIRRVLGNPHEQPDATLQKESSARGAPLSSRGAALS